MEEITDRITEFLSRILSRKLPSFRDNILAVLTARDVFFSLQVRSQFPSRSFLRLPSDVNSLRPVGLEFTTTAMTKFNSFVIEIG